MPGAQVSPSELQLLAAPEQWPWTWSPPRATLSYFSLFVAATDRYFLDSNCLWKVPTSPNREEKKECYEPMLAANEWGNHLFTVWLRYGVLFVTPAHPLGHLRGILRWAGS